MKTNTNMTKVYRAELRDLKMAEAKIRRDYKYSTAGLLRVRKQLDRRLSRTAAGLNYHVEKIRRRRSILEGRLS